MPIRIAAAVAKQPFSYKNVRRSGEPLSVSIRILVYEGALALRQYASTCRQ